MIDKKKEVFKGTFEFYKLDLNSTERSKKIKGIFTPIEFYELDLTETERTILAIYKYYTEKGTLKCCVYTNQQIADIINANVKTVIRAKKRFKELGYIKTDDGIRTYYTGIAEGQNE